MLYSDGNGFPLAIKPSHLFGSTERMDVADVLSAIVEEACRYEPDVPVGKKNVKRFKALTSVEAKEALTSVEAKEALTSVEAKEAFTDSEKIFPKAALTSVVNKVPVVAASSNFVRF